MQTVTRQLAEGSKMTHQYPASWRIWRVEGTGRTNRPAIIRVRANDHNEAVRIASTRHHMRVTACVLIDNA